jgi:hypothetical protein
MDLRDPDEDSVRSLVQIQDDADERWQAARHRVLKRADLHCERCHAEHNKSIWKYLYDPFTWWPVVPGQPPHRRDLYVVIVNVIVVPTVMPWTGEDDDLRALCVGCWLWSEVEAVRERKHRKELGDLPGQQNLFA